MSLLSLSVALFVVTPWLKSPLREEWRTIARWSLWFGAVVTIMTGLTGWYAYNTVAHDDASHAAMTDHRDRALTLIAIFLVLAGWSMFQIRWQRPLGVVFVIGMVFGGGDGHRHSH